VDVRTATFGRAGNDGGPAGEPDALTFDARVGANLVLQLEACPDTFPDIDRFFLNDQLARVAFKTNGSIRIAAVIQFDSWACALAAGQENRHAADSG